MATFVKDYLKNHTADELIQLIGSKLDRRYTVKIENESEINDTWAYISYTGNLYKFYGVKLWINRYDKEIVVQSNIIASWDYDQVDFNTYSFTYGSSIEQLVDFYDDMMFKVKFSDFKQKEYSITKRKKEMNADFV